jgi:hypothetical protein
MACQRCIVALESAGQVLHELVALDPDDLPPGTNWTAIAEQLVQLAGVLRKAKIRTDLLGQTGGETAD